MHELRREAEAQRKALTADILAGLGRPATTIDMIAASNLAGLYVRANKLEAAGRDATEIRRQINQALRTTGFRPAKAEPPKPVDPSANAVEWLNSFKKPSTDATPSNRTASSSAQRCAHQRARQWL